MSRAILLVDHGSKFEPANRMLESVADLVRSRSAGASVFTCHMELAEPTLSQAFAAAVAGGATEIVVHPYFLAPGRHATRDIPRLAAEAAAAFPGVAWRVTEPLGLHAKIAEVILERVEAAPAQGTGPMNRSDSGFTQLPKV